MNLNFRNSNELNRNTKRDAYKGISQQKRCYKRPLNNTRSTMTFPSNRNNDLYTITESPYLEEPPSAWDVRNASFPTLDQDTGRQVRKETVRRSLDIIIDALDIVGHKPIAHAPPGILLSDDESEDLTSLDDSENSLTKIKRTEGKSLMRTSSARWRDPKGHPMNTVRSCDRPPTRPVRRNSQTHLDHLR